MSEENVELARRYFEAFDAQGLQGTEHLRHPEIEYFDPPNLPDADRYVGEAAVRERLTRRVTELGWDGKFHVQEYLDAGDEVVVVWQLRGRSTHGLPFEGTFAYRCRFEDGKLRRQRMSPRLREHWTRAEALEAAGLSE
jgi:ketosteroid isomerase-like protein